MKRAFVVGLAAGGVALAGWGLASAQAPGADTLARGQAVYERWCSHCHAPGPGHPGTQSLQIKYNGELPAVLLEREDLTPEVVATFVRQGVASMAHFRKTEITDDELDALGQYIAQAHTD